MNLSDIKKKLPLPAPRCDTAIYILTSALKIEIEKTGLRRAVIGLSGGIDSALSLYLAVQALGKENVTAVFMPYKLTAASSRTDAQAAANALGVEFFVEDITEMADAYFHKISNDSPTSAKLRKGNILARLRMIILYDYSAMKNGLVVGTSNKTESLLGYSTLWGDMASAINPLGDLYKFQVYALSRYLDIPGSIINKAPSADLWEGQTDEGELKMSYDFIDRILYHWIDLGWDKERISGVLPEEVNSSASEVFRRVMTSQYKRKMPLIIKVSEKTIDREFRYPRDWGL
jgi:NAD+ synthase